MRTRLRALHNSVFALLKRAAIESVSLSIKLFRRVAALSAPLAFKADPARDPANNPGERRLDARRSKISALIVRVYLIARSYRLPH